MVVFWVYGFPLILAVILGLAFRTNRVKPPTVDVVVDQADAAFPVAAILEKHGLTAMISDRDAARKRLRQSKTAMIIVQTGAGLEYIVDPTRSDSVGAQHWVDAILVRARLDLASIPEAEVVDVVEPGSRYIDFLLPGIIGINLMGGGLFGVGFYLVDMRVRKLFKRLMATPMRHGDFLASLLAARMIFLVPEMLTMLVVARLLFGVPIRGSIAELALVIVLGALTFAGLGLLIGSRTEKTETASGLVNLVMLPMYLFSGVFFSSWRFPDAAQPFIQALPLTRLNHALREVMLEGAGLADISTHLIVLLIWIAASFALALRWFRWS